MAIHEDKTYYIYALCEPDSLEVRYIGTSIHPKTRLREHLTRWRYEKHGEKQAWILQLKKDGIKPVLTILDSCSGWGEARQKEREYFDKHNNGRLLNSESHVRDGLKNNVPAILDPSKCQAITRNRWQCMNPPKYNGRCKKHQDRN